MHPHVRRLLALIAVAVVLPLTGSADAARPHPGTYTRVDNRPGGTAPVDGSSGAVLSGDGRYAAWTWDYYPAFSNQASTRIPQVYLRDGTTGRQVLVSHTPAGRPADRESAWLSISTDGRYVSYTSYATDLPGYDGTDTGRIYRYDVATGRNRLVAKGTLGAISATGRYLAFASSERLVPSDTNDAQDIYRWDAVGDRLTLVSRSRDGGAADGDSFGPDVSARGAVAFASSASNVSAVSNPDPTRPRAYLWDPVTRHTSLVSRNAGGPLMSYDPTISDDGRFLTIRSLDQPDGTESDSVWQLYSFRVRTGRLSAIVDGGSGLSVSYLSGSMSADGRYVLVELNNGVYFEDPRYRARTEVYDRRTDTVRTVLAGPSGYGLSLSGDGQHVSLVSWDDRLAPGDDNRLMDAYVWSRS